MNAPRTSRRTSAWLPLRVGLAAFLALLPGCGGATPEVDNAEVIQKEAPKPVDPAPSKPAPEPATTTPDAPKE